MRECLSSWRGAVARRPSARGPRRGGSREDCGRGTRSRVRSPARVRVGATDADRARSGARGAHCRGGSPPAAPGADGPVPEARPLAPRESSTRAAPTGRDPPVPLRHAPRRRTPTVRPGGADRRGPSSPRNGETPCQPRLTRGSVLCAREELNLHALIGHWHLKPARLPFRHSRSAALRQLGNHSTAARAPGNPFGTAADVPRGPIADGRRMPPSARRRRASEGPCSRGARRPRVRGAPGPGSEEPGHPQVDHSRSPCYRARLA